MCGKTGAGLPAVQAGVTRASAGTNVCTATRHTAKMGVDVGESAFTKEGRRLSGMLVNVSGSVEFPHVGTVRDR